MTRYKLHASLGGGELESVSDGVSRVEFHLPGMVGNAWLPRSVLTEIKPKRPEPPRLAVVFGVDGRVFQRRPGAGDCRWAEVGNLQRWTWEALCEDYEERDLLRMVAVEPTGLPWQHISHSGYTTTVEALPDGTAPGVVVELECGDIVTRRYNVNDARELARAIMTAADEVEGADQS